MHSRKPRSPRRARALARPTSGDRIPGDIDMLRVHHVFALIAPLRCKRDPDRGPCTQSYVGMGQRESTSGPRSKMPRREREGQQDASMSMDHPAAAAAPATRCMQARYRSHTTVHEQWLAARTWQHKYLLLWARWHLPASHSDDRIATSAYGA